MTTRRRALGLLLGLSVLGAGCTPMSSSRRLDPASHAAYTVSIRGPRSSEFAELQQKTGRETDNTDSKGTSANSASTGVQLASSETKSSSKSNATDAWLTLVKTAEEQNPEDPRPMPAPSAPPIFENGERLPAPKSVPPRDMPTVEGQRLRLGPGESAAERAVLLAQMLDAAQAESRTLRDRVRALEFQVQEVDRARDEERKSAAQAAADAVRYRLRMEALDEEVAALRERLRRAEIQDMETLREIISVLERLLNDERPAKTSSH